MDFHQVQETYSVAKEWRREEVHVSKAASPLWGRGESDRYKTGIMKD
jgi:hypothetical protein